MYAQQAEWVEGYLRDNVLGMDDPSGNKSWQITTGLNIEIENVTLEHSLGNPEAEEDLKNIKRLYAPMVQLPLDIATDERFWAYLTHIEFRDYMKSRAKNHDILENYFFKSSKTEGDRSFFRNSIARLWWFGHMTYDASLNNPFDLTEYLFQIIDFAQQFGERAFSRNPLITKSILSTLKYEIGFSPRGSTGREAYRKLFKHINRIGGVKVLDFLDEEDIKNIVHKGLAS